MGIGFKLKDTMHKVIAKFERVFLPGMKKPYTLRAVLQPELDVHGVASKAEVYNIETDPKVIEEGFNAACELMYYLSADGYKIKTPLFTLKIRLPGEYNGSETALPEGVYAEAGIQAAAAYQRYLRDTVQVQFDGVNEAEGLIAGARDEHTEQDDEVMTIGNLLRVHGYGLKIKADAEHQGAAGLWFDDGVNAPVKAQIVAVNEPKNLKVVVPASLVAGTDYALKVVTQFPGHGGGKLLKDLREVRSDFTLTAQA
ncbi:MAG: DUF4469 domain-containing protein [Spirochaetaceae bacterium]|jgi:hypothetical protein|nr:DUF4469 domain-containing protein [Spirochaetaceae bacterium]